MMGYYPYPAPRRNAEAQSNYDAACNTWAQGLSERQLRELTIDYMVGRIDEATTDAYEEYRRRESLGLLSESESARSSLKTRKSRSGKQSHK